MKVLLVDDDAFMRDLIGETLLKTGVSEVKAASGGQEALDLLNAPDAAFNLVMSDLYMPDMDGIEFLDYVKASGFDGGVILFSGVNLTILEQAGKLAIEKGVQILGYLEKPITQEALKNLLISTDFIKDA